MQAFFDAVDTSVRAVFLLFLQCLWVLQKIYNAVFHNEQCLTKSTKPIEGKNNPGVQKKINLMAIINQNKSSPIMPSRCSKSYCIMTPTEEAMIRCACAKGYTRKKYRQLA